LRAPQAGLGHAEEAQVLSASPPWRDYVWHAFRANHLTPLHRDVLLRLGEYARCGAIWPSHQTLAERARCHVETVRRALSKGRDLGLIDWAERRVRRGWRWLRTTNVYRLLKPASGAHSKLADPVQPGLRGRCATNPQAAGGEIEKKTKGRCEKDTAALVQLLAVASTMPDLLAARREALTARWRGQLRVT
jgi:hypothetical protein